MHGEVSGGAEAGNMMSTVHYTTLHYLQKTLHHHASRVVKVAESVATAGQTAEVAGSAQDIAAVKYVIYSQ